MTGSDVAVVVAVETPKAVPASTKLERVIALLRRPQGATLAQMAQLTGWEVRSVRGFLSGVLKAKRGLAVVSDLQDGERVYRIDGPPA